MTTPPAFRRRRIVRIRLQPYYTPVMDISASAMSKLSLLETDTETPTRDHQNKRGKTTKYLPMTKYFPMLVPHFNSLQLSYRRNNFEEFCKSARELCAAYEILLVQVEAFFKKPNLLHHSLARQTRRLALSLDPGLVTRSARGCTQEGLMREALMSAHSAYDLWTELINLAMDISGSELKSPMSTTSVIDFTPPEGMLAWGAQSGVYYDKHLPYSIPRAEVTYSIDENGKIKAISLSAIVVLLTSNARHRDPELFSTAMTCFRFFSSAPAFLSALGQRFHNLTRVELRDPEGRLVNEHVSFMRARVLKILISWLQDFWRPEDAVILHSIQNFISQCSKYPPWYSDLLSELQTHVNFRNKDEEMARLSGLYSISSGNSYRRLRRVPQVQLRPPTKFEYPKEHPSSFDFQLIAFNSPAGRLEFARQLTLLLSNMFMEIQPYDAVSFWRKAEKSTSPRHAHLPSALAIHKLATFVNALSFWVSKSIISAEDRQRRVQLIEFWVDIALICLRENNFIGSCSITNGVGFSAVTRMRETMLLAGASHKAEYRKLENCFNPSDNYARYRHMLMNAGANSLPLITILNRDIYTSSLATIQHETRHGKKDDFDLISMKSYRIILKSMRTMERSHNPFPFQRHDPFQTWMTQRLTEFSENPKGLEQLHRLSEDIEKTNPAIMTLFPLQWEPWEFNGKELNGEWKIVRVKFDVVARRFGGHWRKN